MKFFGLITARAGSKGLPGKNTKVLNGQPLIQWTIDAAQDSQLDELILSSNCKTSIDICRRSGVTIPFTRPETISEDSTPHIDVIDHALDWMRNSFNTPDYLVILQPTSPLRTAKHINKAIELALDTDADEVLSVFEAGHHHPYIAKKIDSFGLSPFFNMPDHVMNAPRQTYSKAYMLNGAIYVLKVAAMKNIVKLSVPLIMTKEESIDIDTHLDFKMAEFIMESNDAVYREAEQTIPSSGAQS